MKLPPQVRAAMMRHAEACYPGECCGALLGDERGEVHVRPLGNVAEAPGRAFELSAPDYLAVEAEAEAHGWTVLGFYHSHPDAPAVPSGRDAEFAWARWWTVIVPVTPAGASAPRAWRFDEARRDFKEVDVA